MATAGHKLVTFEDRSPRETSVALQTKVCVALQTKVRVALQTEAFVSSHTEACVAVQTARPIPTQSQQELGQTSVEAPAVSTGAFV